MASSSSHTSRLSGSPGAGACAVEREALADGCGGRSGCDDVGVRVDHDDLPCSSSEAGCPVVMCCWDTRPQRQHLALAGLGRSGAESRRSWCGRSRWCRLGRAGAPPRRLAAFRVGLLENSSAGPTRRPRASGAGAPHARRWVITRKRSSRSATFTVRPGPAWARPEGAERPEDPEGCWSEDAWHNDTARRGATSLSTRTDPLFLLLSAALARDRSATGFWLWLPCKKKAVL